MFVAVRFQIKVVPSSGRLKCVLDKTNRLKCYLKAPAEKGKANKELVQFLAKKIGVTQDKIVIVAGGQSRNKIVEILLNISYEQFLQYLDIEIQNLLFS